MAEFERALIQERVKAGLRNAKAKGKKLGRSRADVDQSRSEALRASGAPWGEIAEKLAVGLGTVHRSLQPRSKNVSREFSNGQCEALLVRRKIEGRVRPPTRTTRPLRICERSEKSSPAAYQPMSFPLVWERGSAPARNVLLSGSLVKEFCIRNRGCPPDVWAVAVLSLATCSKRQRSGFQRVHCDLWTPRCDLGFFEA